MGKKDKLSGFLFGNVNESGELDQEDEFFDNQLKKDLQSFSKRNKIASLSSLGIDEVSNNNNVQSNDRSSITSASSFVPNHNAQDFEDIGDDDLAEDQDVRHDLNKKISDQLARQAEANIQNLRKQQQNLQFQQFQQIRQTKPKNDFDDLDFDNDTTTTSTSSSNLYKPLTTTTTTTSSTGKDIVMVDQISDEQRIALEKKRIYKLNTQNVAYETIKTILETPDRYSIDDLEFKTFACAKNADGTVILKFSQFFAPRLPDKPRKRRKHKALPPLSVTEDSMDYDETIIFNQSRNLRNLNKWKNKQQELEKQQQEKQEKQQEKLHTLLGGGGTGKEGKQSQSMMAAAEAAEEQEQEQEGEEYIPESFKESIDKELLESLNEIDSHDFTSFQQTNWEDKIIWSIPNHNDDGQQDEDDDDYDDYLGSSHHNNHNNRIQSILTDKKFTTLLYLDPIDVNISKNEDSSPLGKRKRWGMLEIEITDSNKNSTSNGYDSSKQIIKNINKNDNGEMDVDNKEKINKQGEVSGDQEIQPNTFIDKEMEMVFESKINKWSLFPIQNEELDNGSWVDNIIWDENVIPKSLQNSVLILDLNDKDMLFEEHMERHHDSMTHNQLQNGKPMKKKSKKKIALEQSLLATAASLASFHGGTIENPLLVSNKPLNPTLDEMDEDEPTVTTKSRTTINPDQIDPFNLSNDKYYKTVGKKSKVKQQQQGKLIIYHSIPGIKLSLVKTHLSNDDLLNFHRPKLHFPLNQVFRVQLFHKQDNLDGIRKSSTTITTTTGNNNNNNVKVEVMKHKSDLSAREGRVVLMEFVEQYPAILGNVGMGTKLRNYYKKKDSDDTPLLLNYEDGELIHLEPNEEGPFLGDVNSGQSVQGIFNNLFRAPIYKHNPNPTDFLLVRSKDHKRWYIREVSGTYIVGQNLPEFEVPAPNSKNANMFLKSRLQAFIYRLFLKKSNTQKRVKISDVCSAFPNQSETSIRKRLKDCADFQRGGDDSGWWTVKEKFILPNEEEFQKLVTPEVVCSYEAMLFGLQRLQEIGIIHFTTAGTIPNVLSNLDDSDPIKKKYRPVEDELTLTSWNLTSSYLQAMQGKGKMQLIADDGSTRDDEFSFIKMPQKVVNQKQKAIKQALQKNQVTGTDADLRKLSLVEAKNVLLELGVSEKVINELKRWQRIDLVRKKSSEAALASDPTKSMTKFARGTRYSLDHQNLQYKEQAQLIFENQMKTLSGKDNIDDIDNQDKSLAELQKDLEESLFGTSSKSKQRGFLFDEDEDDDDLDEEEDRQEFNKLNFSNPTTPSLQSQKSNPNNNNNNNNNNRDIVMSPTLNTSINSSSNNPNNNTNTSNIKVEDDLSQGDRMFVKRTTLFQKPDGTLFRRIEIIRDPRQVKEYQSKKPDLLHKKLNGITEEEEKKRELQGLYKRLKSEESQNNLKISSANLGSSNSSINKPNPPPMKIEQLSNSSTKIRIGSSGAGYSVQNTSSSNLNSSSNNNLNSSSHSHHRSTNSDRERDRDGRHHRSNNNERDGHSGSSSSSSSNRHHRNNNNNDREGSSSSSNNRHHRSNSGDSYSQMVSIGDSNNEINQVPQSPLTQSGSSTILRIKKEDLSNALNSSSNSTNGGGVGSNNNRKKKPAQDPSLPTINEQDKSGNRRNRGIRKDGGGAEVGLSNIFDNIIEKLRSTIEFGAFKHKVTPNIAPDYHRIIKNPIDLTTMRDRNRTWEYKSQNQFLDAIKLMVKNCFDYNENRNPHLLPIVQRIQTVATAMLKEREKEIDELEKSIEQHLTNSTNLKSVPLSASTSSSSFSNQINSPSLPPPPTTPLTTISLTNNDSSPPQNQNNYFPQTKSYEDEEIDIVTFSSNSPATGNN